MRAAARRRRADLAEMVTFAEGLRARASGLVALLAERARSNERDRAANVDRDVVSSLEAEAASLSDQLAGTERDAQELLPLEVELAVAEGRRLRRRPNSSPLCRPGGRSGTGGNGLLPPGQLAGEVRAELSALRRATEQMGTELLALPPGPKPWRSAVAVCGTRRTDQRPCCANRRLVRALGARGRGIGPALGGSSGRVGLG